MLLVKAKCPKCGQVLGVNSRNEAEICTYCGVPFITEKAINTYNFENGRSSKTNIYNVNNSEDFEIVGGVLKKYLGNELEVIIPESVLEIDNSVFANTYIESVVLPNKIKKIGVAAFKNCKNLTRIEFPESLEEIDAYAFKGCISLTKIRIPSKIKIIWFETFEGCTNLAQIELCEGLTKLESDAFGNCSIESIIIPKSVNYIQVTDHYDWRDAFSGCSNLQSITCPDPTSKAVLNWLNYSDEPIAIKYRVKKWKDKGVCTYCGSPFKGIVNVRCSRCNKEKNY